MREDQEHLWWGGCGWLESLRMREREITIPNRLYGDLCWSRGHLRGLTCEINARGREGNVF